jgi:hypothetical protein
MEARLKQIIGDSFPELLRFDFSVEYDKLNDSFAETWQVGVSSYIFALDESFREAEEDVVIGLLVHELSHISQDLDLTGLEARVDGFLNDNFSRYSLLDERNADLTAVIRGYGMNLLKLMRYLEKNYPSYETEGLSVSELEILLGIH